MDEDRGTYSPPTEDNLSFEPRRSAVRDQAPLTLIVSGILLVVLLVFVVLFYNSGLNNHGRTPPDVGSPVGEFKDAQIQDAKPLTGDDAADGQAKFAPSAEAPALRDAASATVDEAPAPVAPIKGGLPSQADNPAVNGGANNSASDSTPVPGAPQAAAESAGKLAIDRALTPPPATRPTRLADATPAAPALKPAIAKPAAKPADSVATSAATTASAGGAVQIGAFTSAEIANKEYASLASSYGLFLGGTSKHIEKVDKNGTTFYRTSFAGFASKDKAKAFCSALKSAGHDCIVK